jgi:hypothetical protein
MNTFRRLILPLAAVSALGVGIASAQTAAPAAAPDTRQQAMEHKFELAKKYYGECAATSEAEFEAIRPYLKAFTDAEVMAQTMADPGKFMKLMSIVMDPRTIKVMAQCSTEPVMWDTWMRGLTDYNKLGRAMLQFMNPMMYLNWMAAPLNPQFYQPLMTMADPNWYGRWFTALQNPAFYKPFYQPMVDPNWYTPRVNWMLDPNSYMPMVNMFAIPGVTAPAAAPAPAPAKK